MNCISQLHIEEKMLIVLSKPGLVFNLSNHLVSKTMEYSLEACSGGGAQSTVHTKKLLQF